MAPGASVTYNCSLADVTNDLHQRRQRDRHRLERPDRQRLRLGNGDGHRADHASNASNASDASDASDASTRTPHAKIVIVKDPKSQTIGQGGTADFTITVSNTGDVTLTNVTVTDPLSPSCNRSLGTLAVGKSKHFTCTKTNVSADFENIATATGKPPTTATVKATDHAHITVKPFIPPQHPKIAIVKSPKTQVLTTSLRTVKSGTGKQTTVTYGTAHFTIKVTNDGDVTLHSVNVTDPASPGCNRTLGTLASHASKTYTCSRSTVRANFKNVATAHGISPKGVKVNATDHANVSVTVKTTSTSAAQFAG